MALNGLYCADVPLSNYSLTSGSLINIVGCFTCVKFTDALQSKQALYCVLLSDLIVIYLVRLKVEENKVSVWKLPVQSPEPVEGPPAPPGRGGLTYAQGPHVTYEKKFLLF